MRFLSDGKDLADITTKMNGRGFNFFCSIILNVKCNSRHINVCKCKEMVVGNRYTYIYNIRHDLNVRNNNMKQDIVTECIFDT